MAPTQRGVALASVAPTQQGVALASVAVREHRCSDPSHRGGPRSEPPRWGLRTCPRSPGDSLPGGPRLRRTGLRPPHGVQVPEVPAQATAGAGRRRCSPGPPNHVLLINVGFTRQLFLHKLHFTPREKSPLAPGVGDIASDGSMAGQNRVTASHREEPQTGRGDPLLCLQPLSSGALYATRGFLSRCLQDSINGPQFEKPWCTE